MDRMTNDIYFEHKEKKNTKITMQLLTKSLIGIYSLCIIHSFPALYIFQRQATQLWLTNCTSQLRYIFSLKNFSLLTYKWLILHNRYSKLLSQLVQGYQIFILQSIKYLWRSNGALYNQFLLEMNVQSHSLIINQQMQKNLLGTDLSF